MNAFPSKAATSGTHRGLAHSKDPLRFTNNASRSLLLCPPGEGPAGATLKVRKARASAPAFPRGFLLALLARERTGG